MTSFRMVPAGMRIMAPALARGKPSSSFTCYSMRRIQFALFLEQLVFLDDVEDTGIQFLNTSVTRAELVSFFEAHTRANAERL